MLVRSLLIGVALLVLVLVLVLAILNGALREAVCTLILVLTWLALAAAFEFLAGHHVFGKPWSRLIADYDVLHGRVWVLVVLTTVAAPMVLGGVGALRGHEVRNDVDDHSTRRSAPAPVIGHSH
jgi:hypothetical protein